MCALLYWRSLNRGSQTSESHQQLEKESALVQVPCGGPIALRKVVLEHLAQFAAKLFVGDCDSNFKIQAKRSVVKIRCANAGQLLIDQHDLLVEKTGLVAIEFDPCRFGGLDEGIAGKPNQFVIRFTRQHDPHIQPLQGG